VTGSTKVRWTTRGVTLLLAALAAAGPAQAEAEADARVEAGRLLVARCALPACHGAQAEGGMRLDAASLYRSTVNVRSRSESGSLRVVPRDPERSLLYRRLLDSHAGGYRGARMPRGMAPLADEEILVIRRWIESFPQEVWGDPAAPEAGPAATLRLFHDGFLANLPTSEPLGAKALQFRIAHRFKAGVTDAGGSDLYGLDSGAWVSLGLAFGFSDVWEAGLRHTNLEQANELYVKATPLRQASEGAPVSVAVVASGSALHEEGLVHEYRGGAQVVVARRFADWLSVMAVPSYYKPLHYLDPDDNRGTFAIGLGAEWRIRDELAIITEWVGQIDGVMAPYQSASIGVSVATARHSFQILLTNTTGTHPDLYLPGGDLDWGDGDFRIGFNLSRTWGLGGGP
jgi:hypothetical protein